MRPRFRRSGVLSNPLSAVLPAVLLPQGLQTAHRPFRECLPVQELWPAVRQVLVP